MNRGRADSEIKVSNLIIIYELILGVVEITTASALIIFGKRLLETYENLKDAELLENPNDLIVKVTEGIIPNLFQHHIYIALLLLAFGGVKIASGIGLIYKKIWAEHLLIGLLLLLIPIDLASMLFHFSIEKLLYILINTLIVLYLIEFKPIEYYNRVRRQLS